MLTILPDYLFRRYGQGKRIGHEITLYSVWFELRWGIVTCLILTITLITTIFYFHPSTKNAVSFYRSVAILPEGSGRVAEVFIDVGVTQKVKAGDPLFRLDSTEQEAAVETARKRIAEVDAELVAAESEVAAAQAQISQAEAALKQAVDEFETKSELMARNSSVVSAREIEKLETMVANREGAVAAAKANLEHVQTRLER